MCTCWWVYRIDMHQKKKSEHRERLIISRKTWKSNLSASSYLFNMLCGLCSTFNCFKMESSVTVFTVQHGFTSVPGRSVSTLFRSHIPCFLRLYSNVSNSYSPHIPMSDPLRNFKSNVPR